MFWKLAALASLAALVGVRATSQDKPVRVAVVRLSEFYNTEKCPGYKASKQKAVDLANDLNKKSLELDAKAKDAAAAVGPLPKGSAGQVDAIERYERAKLDFTLHVQKSEIKINRAYADARIAIFKEIQKHAADIAAKEGYQIVLKLDETRLDDASLENVSGGIALTSVIWADAAVDISKAVLDKLNKEFKP